jgi:8-oxo-dGTP diphosphatase
MKESLAKLWKALGLSTKFQLRIMRILQDEFLVGVTGIIVDEENRILLVKHTYRGGWSLPGGYLKAGEHPKEGLEREIKEESSLIVSVDERIKIRTDRKTARLDITYKGKFIGGEFKPTNEVSEAKFFKFEELPMIRRDQLIFIEKALNLNT